MKPSSSNKRSRALCAATLSISPGLAGAADRLVWSRDGACSDRLLDAIPNHTHSSLRCRMSNGSANLSVWVGDKLVCIKIAGRASFQGSVDFKTLITTLWQQGHTRFVLDLGECQLMDSTFLGVLAGLGLKFSQERNGNRPATIELLNPSQRVFDLIDNLGIAHLFQVHHGEGPATDDLSPLAKAAATPNRTETTRTCLEAHKLLMEINPANVSKFKDVTRFLEEDLKKLSGR